MKVYHNKDFSSCDFPPACARCATGGCVPAAQAGVGAQHAARAHSTAVPELLQADGGSEGDGNGRQRDVWQQSHQRLPPPLRRAGA